MAYSKTVRPAKDVVLAQVYLNACEDERPLVVGEIVQASIRTCTDLQIGPKDAVHFRKTYYPGAGGKPEDEYDRSMSVWVALPDHCARPLGFEPGVFRSSLVRGTAWAALSPFSRGQNYLANPKPEPCSPGAARDLWDGLEKLYAVFSQLHRTHSHGDAHRNNVLMVREDDGKLSPKLIDFEDAQDLSQLSSRERQEAVEEDLIELLQEARLLQEHFLGPQHTPLGIAARQEQRIGLEV